MGTATSPFIEGLVDAEIRRLVGEAIAGRTFVSTAECVAKVKHLYPTCGLSKREIEDKVIAAATAAGLPVEIGGVRRQSSGRASAW